MPFTPYYVPLPNTVTITTKPKSLVTEIYCALGNRIFFAATPYEAGGGATALITPFEPQDGFYFLDSAYYTQGQTYRTQGGGLVADGGPQSQVVKPRQDMRFVSASTTGNGWEFQIEIRGNKQLHTTIYAGREIKICIREFVDGPPDDEGFDTRVCINSTWIRAFIKDEGGITTTLSPNGEQRCVVTAVTPEYFLAKTRLPRMPYILQSVVAAERAKWSTMKHKYDDLGFTPANPDDTLGFTQDPFSGFADFVDEFNSSYNDVLTPRPANAVHMLSSCSVAYALQELFAHHVLAGYGGGLSNIGATFRVEIVPDGEYRVVSLEISPGSPHSACLEALRHGNYRYWWDAQSNMHFIRDYCNPGVNPDHWPELKADRNFTGDASVTPGPPSGYPIVNRVGVEGQWSSPPDGDQPAIVSWQTAPNKYVYPAGRQVGRGGEEVAFQGYHGEMVSAIARSEYNRLLQKTVVTIANLPYACWALNAYQRKIKLYVKDPMGNFDFSAGRDFSVENVQIQMQEIDTPGGGIPMVTVTLVQVVNNA